MTFHFIVNCVKSKTLTGGPSIARLPREGFIEATVREWKKRLRKQAHPLREARFLYRGQLWSICREAFEAIPTRDKKLWVISAGYGLVSGDGLIGPYEATFMGGEPSSIYNCIGPRGGPRVGVLQRWWGFLCDQSDQQPASLAELMGTAGADDRFFFAVSQDYLDAIWLDLNKGIALLPNPQNVAVVSSSRPQEAPEWLLYAPPQQRRITSTAEAARLLLREVLPVEDWNLTAFHHQLSFSQSIPLESGTKQTDTEVLDFIRTHLMNDPKFTRTQLLKKLRAGGRACEQLRFKGLYEEVLGDLQRNRCDDGNSKVTQMNLLSDLPTIANAYVPLVEAGHD
jgi:hypothetical protein